MGQGVFVTLRGLGPDGCLIWELWQLPTDGIRYRWFRTVHRRASEVTRHGQSAGEHPEIAASFPGFALAQR